MSYQCNIVADSIADNGCRLTTFEITMPRIVLAEHNTHRMFSRNTASSRAIPSSKFLEAVKTNPFIPERFPKNQSGMSNAEWLEGDEHVAAEAQWLYARDQAVKHVENLTSLNVHKQIANRILEPFMWITSVTSATDWNNYFAQRCSEFAQPEISKIAYMIRDAYNQNEPTLVDYGDWHLPYVTQEEKDLFGEDARYLSAGRSGRVSYLNHGINNTPEKDIALAKEKMIPSRHWSVAEHCATPLKYDGYLGNFCGWKQLRKFYEGESGEIQN